MLRRAPDLAEQVAAGIASAAGRQEQRASAPDRPLYLSRRRRKRVSGFPTRQAFEGVGGGAWKRSTCVIWHAPYRMELLACGLIRYDGVVFIRPPTDMDGHLISDIVLVAPLIPPFKAICRSLQITSKDDPLAEVVALKVIQAAKTGERDTERLRDLVLLALRNASSRRLL